MRHYLAFSLFLGAWVCSVGITPSPVHADSVEAALQRLFADDILLADRAVDELVALGDPAIEALLPLLADERRDVKAGAIRGLGLLEASAAAKPIRDLLRQGLEQPEPDTMEDRYFRVMAIQALGRIGDHSSVDLLRRVSTDGDRFERAHAAISLFLLDEDPGYDLLRNLAQDSEMALRSLVAEGLHGSVDDRAVQLLLTLANDSSWVVRDAAFRALAASLSREPVVESLRAGMSDSSWFVRETVREILSNGGIQPSPPSEDDR